MGSIPILSNQKTAFLKAVFKEFNLETHEVPNILTFNHQINPEVEAKNNKVSLIVTRQFEELYNIPLAINAFKRIKTEWPEATLKLAGNGSQRKKLENYVEKMNIQDVIFLGELRVKYEPEHKAHLYYI